MVRVLRAAWWCLLVGFAAFLGYDRTRAVDAGLHDTYSANLRRLPALDATLNEAVLQTHLGLLVQYDPLVRAAAALDHAHAELARAPGFLSPRGRAEVAARRAESAEALARKEDVLEAFKTEHAVLRNSLRFFPIAAGELAEALESRGGDAGTAVAVRRLLGDVLVFNTVTRPDAAARAEGSLQALREVHRSMAEGADRADLGVLLAHARVVLERRPRTDALVAALVALPTAQRAEALEASYARHHEAAVESAGARRVVLALWALAVVGLGASLVILRLQRAARELGAATAELRVANAALTREKDRERELHDLKSRFVSTTSHEFRTPLSIILSSVELLDAYGERWPAERRRDHLGRIQTAVAGMVQLLDDVLALGRAEAGALACRPEDLDLPAFCAQLVDELQPGAGAAGRVALAVQGAWAPVRMDPGLLRAILFNLLSNALKYSPAGTPVHLELRTDAGASVLEVRDEGIGVPAEDLARLFDSFHRARNVGTIPGTGLGLAIVKRAVEAHGGEVTVRSAVGVGTMFTVRLPARG